MQDNSQSSIIAFRLPEGAADHFQIVASHSDSPCFKLKPAAAREANGYATLNVEKYGGMIMSSWFYNGPLVKTTHQDIMVNGWPVEYRLWGGITPDERHNAGLGVYAAKVPLIMGTRQC